MNEPDARIKVGSVVQLDPFCHLGIHDGFFAACFMVVTEIKPWGAEGYVSSPQERGAAPLRAFYRANHHEMRYIGEAEWTYDAQGQFEERSSLTLNTGGTDV